MGDKDKQIADIVETFNRHLSRILKVVKSFEPNNVDLETVMRLIRIARYENPTHVLERSVDKFWDNRDKVIARDLDFFYNNTDMLKEKYVKKDVRQGWIESLVDHIHKNISKLTEDQTTYIWDCLNELLQCVIRYRIVVGDFA
jgi:hypothetical protein